MLIVQFRSGAVLLCCCVEVVQFFWGESCKTNDSAAVTLVFASSARQTSEWWLPLRIRHMDVIWRRVGSDFPICRPGTATIEAPQTSSTSLKDILPTIVLLAYRLLIFFFFAGAMVPNEQPHQQEHEAKSARLSSEQWSSCREGASVAPALGLLDKLDVPARKSELERDAGQEPSQGLVIYHADLSRTRACCKCFLTMAPRNSKNTGSKSTKETSSYTLSNGLTTARKGPPDPQRPGGQHGRTNPSVTRLSPVVPHRHIRVHGWYTILVSIGTRRRIKTCRP